MSNNKQSSVEWLVSQLKISTYWDTLIAQLELMDLEIDDIIEQAKAMHKEEHRKTYYQGVRSNFQDFYGYYIETFGGNNEQQ